MTDAERAMVEEIGRAIGVQFDSPADAVEGVRSLAGIERVLRATRDELLALCKDMVDAIDAKMVEAHDGGGLVALGYEHGETCCLCRARAVIAKVVE